MREPKMSEPTRSKSPAAGPEPTRTGRTVDLPGMRAHVDERGTGPAVVFVHGLGGDSGSWARIWPYLDVGRRYVRYDLRDFGLSIPKSQDEFTHVADLGDLLNALQIGECDLVGVSMGGGVALSFAIDQPERVRSLTLISPQIAGWEWSDAWQERWQVITSAAKSGNLEEAKQSLWDHPMFASTRATAASNDLREEIERFAGGTWIRDNHALVLPDIERLHELQLPTLLLSGERDLDEFRLMADILEGSAANIRRTHLPGGHLLQMELPELCAKEITAFLETHSPQR